MEFFDVLKPNGEYANITASRDECHKIGLWHKAVAVFIIDPNNSRILLQQRSGSKKLWPNLWDISAGGHVLTGEFGYDAVIRETYEELGVKLDENHLKFIGSTISENIKGDIINRHFNEYYVAFCDVDVSNIKLQTSEVQNAKWFTKADLIEKINNNFDGLTGKYECWNYLNKFLELMKT